MRCGASHPQTRKAVSSRDGRAPVAPLVAAAEEEAAAEEAEVAGAAGAATAGASGRVLGLRSRVLDSTTVRVRVRDGVMVRVRVRVTQP